VLFGAFEPEALGDGGVGDPGTDIPEVHGVRGSGGSSELPALRFLGPWCLRLTWALGVELLESRCWGPFGVRSAEVPATKLSRLARR